ncbi:sirohydrochlorin cobaltochelatase [uncultured Ruminococcus sp.]|uniref:sirohydrochlorin cobaltochelatase n=1 Tax=uncultured Ruminococcus sp. TaxID=165186 RepID=UPI0026050D49|nr:sirohydrochlorin cobaltochelatase [uncultured Ruminococcus sp.]
MYPVFLEVKGRKCTVIGAGTVAQRRILTLLEQSAAVTVIAPEPIPAQLTKHKLTYVQSRYTPELLAESMLVFAATNDSALNAAIVRDAQEMKILSSSVTDCAEVTPDFSVPAQRHRGKITAAVSTEGSSPGLAAAICRELEPKLEEYAGLCSILEELREEWKTTVPDAYRRRQMLNRLTSPGVLQLYRDEGRQAFLEYAAKLSDGTLPLKKTAILAVSFGTSYENTREKTIGAVERAIQAAFPEADVFRAFTSGMIIRKMRRSGIEIDTVPEALERLKKAGYTHVYCQPTHVIPGEEYDDLCRDAAQFAHSISVLQIGRPLLTDTPDYPALIHALKESISMSDSKAYVLMGHGTTHIANQAYPAFDYWLKRSGYSNVFVGTVEGYPTLDTVLEQLEETAYHEVVLLPMMLVAGDHAQNDMAGEGEDSWKSILTRHGYHVTALLRGLGEYPAVQALYAAHVGEMLCTEEFDTETN